MTIETTTITAIHHQHAGTYVEDFIVAFNPSNNAFISDETDIGIGGRYDIYFNGPTCPDPIVGDYLALEYDLPDEGGSIQGFWDITLRIGRSPFPVHGDYQDDDQPGWYRIINSDTAWRLQLDHRDGNFNRTDRSLNSKGWFDVAFIPWVKSTAGITDDSLDFGDTLDKRLTLPIIVKLHATDGTLRCTTNFSNASPVGLVKFAIVLGWRP